MFRYSFLVLAGACSIGVLAIFVKFAYQMGFTLGEVIGSQYLTGWLLLLVLTLLFFRQRVPLKKAIALFFAGTSASFTGICYYAALQTIPASIGIVLLFQFVWIGIIIESISTKTLPSKEKIISVLFLLAGTALSGGLLEHHSKPGNKRHPSWIIVCCFVCLLSVCKWKSGRGGSAFSSKCIPDSWCISAYTHGFPANLSLRWSAGKRSVEICTSLRNL